METEGRDQRGNSKSQDTSTKQIQNHKTQDLKRGDREGTGGRATGVRYQWSGTRSDGLLRLPKAVGTVSEWTPPEGQVAGIRLSNGGGAKRCFNFHWA